jgi:hypothetical protein
MIMRLSLIAVIFIGFVHYFRYLFSTNIQRKKILIINLSMITTGLILALAGAITVVNFSPSYEPWINILFFLPVLLTLFSLFTERLYFSKK